MITVPPAPHRATGSACILLAAALLLAPAAALHAEAPVPAPMGDATVLAAPGPDPIDLARALELEARAWSLRDRMDRRSAAARLLREAADLRPAEDPERVRNLREASSMNFHAGHLAQAATDAGDAAKAALRQGDVLQAAHAYLDAAWMAAEDGRTARALAFVEEAMLLTASPLLGDEDRERILVRIRTGA